MVDRINRSGVKRTGYKKSSGAKGGSSSSSSSSGAASSMSAQVTVSDSLQGVIGKLLEEMPPMDDVKKISEIKKALSDGSYEIDHDQVATDIIVEYLAASATEDSEHGDND